MLGPILDDYNVWTGKEQDNEEAFGPAEMLVVSRVIEFIFESLPESVLQTYVLLNSSSVEISDIMLFSIFAYLAASVFKMTDSSVAYERSCMTSR